MPSPESRCCLFDVQIRFFLPSTKTQQRHHGSGTAKSGPKRRFADIRLCNAANVLDHCTLLPGVTVAERVPCNILKSSRRIAEVWVGENGV